MSNKGDSHGPIEMRFLRKVDKRLPNECWKWQGAVTVRGYGKIGVAGKGTGWIFAHRLSYKIHIGEIPEGMMVCHHCDNPPCCNPAHLFLGTNQDNVDDMVSKKRNFPGWRVMPHLKGADHYAAKLTEEQYEQIMEMKRQGLWQAEVVRRLGIGRSVVCDVFNGKHWRSQFDVTLY